MATTISTSSATSPQTKPRRRATRAAKAPIRYIAAGVDGYPEGDDSAVLGAAIAAAAGGHLMLVTVHPDPLMVMPQQLGWKALHRQSETYLRKTRQAYAPKARTRVETDWSVARGLERVASRDHRDLLVVGSSRHASLGEVRIGKRTRQLLHHAPCALAVAPRGLARVANYRLRRIGLGFDGGAESLAALGVAAWLAQGSGAKLTVRAAVDDRLPGASWTGLGMVAMFDEWDEAIRQEMAELRTQTERAAAAHAAYAHVEVGRGRPADALLGLSAEVDLLVIGSRRWGAFSRVMLGSTGEGLMHGARCPILVVPRGTS